jgi:aldehyde:ferredoxin oxidoreductase
LVVDLTNQTLEVEALSEELLYKYVGGRGLNSHVLYQHIDRETNPLGPENVLVFGVGPVTGTLAPGSGRTTISALSPLTVVRDNVPSLGDGNFGGFFGPALKYAGFDQIVIHGRAARPMWLWIDDEVVELRDASHLWGLDTAETMTRITQERGDSDIQVACIGVAGETGCRFATVMTNLARAAGKSGIGAVMGSKRLKAVAVRGTGAVRVARPADLMDAVADTIIALRQDPASQTYGTEGTASLIEARVKAGGLPTRNYQKLGLEGWQNLTAESLKRYWTRSKACFSCPLHCSHHYEILEGPFAGTKGEGPEYGALGPLGSLVGNTDLASVLYLDTLCNRLGVSVSMAGSTIAWAMECWQRGILREKETDGLVLEWGNPEVIIEMVERLARAEGSLGSLLAEGHYHAAQELGRGSEEYVIHVKGQTPGMTDPRISPAWGLAYIVASRGGDHLRALVTPEFYFTPEQAVKYFGSEEAVSRAGVHGKGRMVKWCEELRAMADSLEICKFVVRTGLIFPVWLQRYFNAVTGLDWSEEDIMHTGERINNLERSFNVLRGLVRSAETISARFLENPVESGPYKGYTFDPKPLLDEYYEARGWDENGFPTRQKLEELGLGEVADDLGHAGKLGRG